MSIEIKEVVSRRELKKFIRFPFRLYRNDPYWIPPLLKGEIETLNPSANPAFEHCDTCFLMAFRDGVPAGRIIGIINHRYIEQWGKKDARFSWFDTIDDTEVSGALFDSIGDWARSKGMERLVGPMGFTTFERQGILVKGFEEMPTFAGVHNHSYYPVHLESHGFTKEIEYVEYEVVVPPKVPEKVIKIRDLVSERYRLKLLTENSAKKMLPYADPVFRVVNAAYKPLYGFTELTEKQIAFFVRKYFSYIRPDYTSVVLDANNQAVGFQISMPSLSKAMQKARGRMFPLGWLYLTRAMRKAERLDLLLTGVVPEYQNKGVNAVFMVHLTEAAIRTGIKFAESNNELEENFRVQNTWRYFDSRQHRRTRIYAKILK